MIRLPLKFEHKVLDPVGIWWYKIVSNHVQARDGFYYSKQNELVVMDNALRYELSPYDILGRALEKILQVEDIFVLVDKHNFIGEVVEKIEEIYG